MKPTVDAVASEHHEDFIVARLDIDDNPKTLKAYGVRSIPTYIVFRDGEVVAEFVGGLPKAAFAQRILDTLE